MDLEADALAVPKRKAVASFSLMNRPLYMATCPTCSAMCAIVNGKRKDPLDDGGFTDHPHQPKELFIGWLNSKPTGALTADDYRNV